jgi:hypothetical protein
MSSSRQRLPGLYAPGRVSDTDHETNRLEIVAELVALIGVMVFQKALSGQERVSVIGAFYQDRRGSRSSRTAAAHCLPGHVLFNSMSLHTMPDWKAGFLKQCGLKPLALSSKLRHLFGHTDLVDEVVNQTDSLLEIMDNGRGLKPALERTVYGMMEQVRRRNPASWPALAELVRDGMDGYGVSVRYTYEERCDWLRQKLGSALPSERVLINAKLGVVQNYLKVVKDPSVVPAAKTLAGFLDVVKDVVEGYSYGP